MIEVYKYLKGAENTSHLSKEERHKKNQWETDIQMGIYAHSLIKVTQQKIKLYQPRQYSFLEETI